MLAAGVNVVEPGVAQLPRVVQGTLLAPLSWYWTAQLASPDWLSLAAVNPLAARHLTGLRWRLLIHLVFQCQGASSHGLGAMPVATRAHAGRKAAPARSGQANPNDAVTADKQPTCRPHLIPQSHLRTMYARQTQRRARGPSRSLRALRRASL